MDGHEIITCFHNERICLFSIYVDELVAWRAWPLTSVGLLCVVSHSLLSTVPGRKLTFLCWRAVECQSKQETNPGCVGQYNSCVDEHWTNIMQGRISYSVIRFNLKLVCLPRSWTHITVHFSGHGAPERHVIGQSHDYN